MGAKIGTFNGNLVRFEDCILQHVLTCLKRSIGAARAPVNVLVRKAFQSPNELVIPVQEEEVINFLSDQFSE